LIDLGFVGKKAFPVRSFPSHFAASVAKSVAKGSICSEPVPVTSAAPSRRRRLVIGEPEQQLPANERIFSRLIYAQNQLHSGRFGV
jgi:hypothetical protein